MTPTGADRWRSYLFDYGREVVGCTALAVTGAMGGEVIDTLVDNHADIAADGDADRAEGHEKIRR